ncbi:MAG: O-phosphoserine--tRNA ligase [Nitrososphaerota archaeon]|nr:O-phosphoserine--tRNA ligase [Candidatus Bathyarchaeota archaeon]MDW8048241.1 O-phosphoserine--tRNA ligase [Nitrososphaerota archaeon]
MKGPLEPKEILENVKKEGFEIAWYESRKLLPSSSNMAKLTARRHGASHPIYDLIQRLRLSFLELGFDEVMNPIIIDENEIYKQYGPEAPIILDRCYYLAALPRPDIGLSKSKCEEIKKIGIAIDDAKISALQKVLRKYKKGEIDSDDLVEKIASALETSDQAAIRVVSEVFPEFSTLRPEPSHLTLRSHMTSAWFLTLQALQHKMETPIKLFSIDIRFRREQSEDPTHLRVHHSASCVIMDEEVGEDYGEVIVRALLDPLGIKEFRFVKKKTTSKYYAPGTEYEGFIYNPVSKRWVEVVDYGMYSPIALARYNLEYPVLNVGIGVERLALVTHCEEDIRRLVYPQFYREIAYSDEEIARSISFDIQPETEEGDKIAQLIIAEAIRHAKEPSPCEFLAFEGSLLGKHVQVYLYENETNSTLMGPAGENCLYVYNGNILGVPPAGREQIPVLKEVREKGKSTGIRYIDGIAKFAAANIEEAAKSGKSRVDIRVKMVRRLSDINLKLSDPVLRYIMSHKKKIDVYGPVFLGIRAEISD